MYPKPPNPITEAFLSILIVIYMIASLGALFLIIVGNWVYNTLIKIVTIKGDKTTLQKQIKI
jgi:hypothetical protein